MSTLNSTCISSTEHFSFKCCSHKLLYISQEKKTLLVSTEETYQVPPTDLLLIIMVSSISCPLRPFQLPVFSISNFIYSMMSSTMSWAAESLGVTSNLLSKNHCKRGCSTTLIFYSNKSKRDIHDRFFFMITNNCLTSGIEQVMTQRAYLMVSMICLEKNAFVWGLLLL